ncbi:MAG: sialate O-acetylesterase [Gammaproteobacteria bacterium]|nr:sialate O-acetylesterase [Gammaproteobacteria bacterium]MBU2059504.1 sialate O-acetylesterase [Gammaproteobacteria bacterium]MBU2176202.1 sialate O-acetylesterase [Gammaproteobacteria bacterium]MBU2248135.1 sialate O-acetylesterase [Gammaproteobacteria bacterium]MBU2344584.1 sialate O-acetylesterase [Gammaproteobacteria bacterium]
MKKTLLVMLLLNGFAHADIRLPRLISEGVVLQRETAIPLWGWADADENIEVRLNGQLVGQVKTEEGRWLLQLPAQQAGGPHQLSFKGRNHIELKDIYFGDVWVASGQSNMELEMARVAEAYPQDLTSANYPLIRQFKVPQEYNFKAPQQDLSGGEWVAASPKSIDNFSALAFYFGRELFQHNGVPIGILNNALGGSPVEAWMSEEALQPFPEDLAEGIKFRDDKLIQSITAADKNKNDQWYGDLQRRDPGLTSKTPWYSETLDDSNWQPFIVPGFRPKPFTGVWWLRKTIKLTAAQAKEANILRLGSIVDADEVYINGKQVGNTTYMYPPRRYELPAGALKAGANLIAVRVTATNGKTGLIPDKPYWLGTDANPLALTGQWKMHTAAEAKHLPGDTFIRWKPLGLYNGLLAPLTSLPIKGVIWYQGESNVGAYKDYQPRFTAMIRDWRAKWAEGTGQQNQFPFLFVQLANYLEKTPDPVDSAWAGLREAQRQSLKEANTAMVVAIDKGEWNDIHPVDKKTLGQRLALAARAVALGEKVEYQGPELASVVAEGTQLKLTFNHKAKSLVLKGKGNSFAIAGADGKFHWAQVQLKDQQLLLSHPDIKAPVKVRYAWADNPDAVLYNSEALPAGPFEAGLKP